MRRLRTLTAAAVAAVGLLLVSCSTTPPEIAQTFWQVNLVHDPRSGASNERLSFFVHLSNIGLSDLGSIYLLNDKSELYWRLDPSNWDASEKNGELWVGSNFLRMPGGSSIPRGSYRVLVSNLAGERATGSIFVSSEALNPAKVRFPGLSVEGKMLKIIGPAEGTLVWLYNPEGQLVGSRPALSSGLPLSSIVPAAPRQSQQLTAYAYRYDRECGCGLMSGPYDLSGGQ